MKALTVGSAMIDTIAIIESSRIERMVMRNAETSFLLLEEGRKIEALEVSTHCGGGAVNTAVAMARLGVDVATIVKLGLDPRAETVLRRLDEEAVSTRFVVRHPQAPTGASVLVSSHDRNAAIFTFRGANGLLETGDLHPRAFDVDLVYVSALSNQSAECLPEIVTRAKAKGALVAANPGVRQLSARFDQFRGALASIDVLALNRGEAEVLVPGLAGLVGEGGRPLDAHDGEAVPALAARGLSGGGYDMTLEKFLRAVGELGPRYVVLTDGGAGAFIGTAEEVLFCPVLSTQVVGTAGAGDAFASTFSTEVAAGRSAEEAVRAATVNAGAVLSHVDTQTGLLRRKALDERVAGSRDALKVRRWRL